MSLKRKYNVTGSQNFYGQKDPKTYYNVPAQKMWSCFTWMANNFNLPVLFVYDANDNTYLGSYSHKYQNFTDANKQRHKTYNF